MEAYTYYILLTINLYTYTFIRMVGERHHRRYNVVKHPIEVKPLRGFRFNKITEITRLINFGCRFALDRVISLASLQRAYPRETLIRTYTHLPLPLSHRVYRTAT